MKPTESTRARTSERIDQICSLDFWRICNGVGDNKMAMVMVVGADHGDGDAQISDTGSAILKKKKKSIYRLNLSLNFERSAT